MTLARCRRCRRELSAEEPVCPHCGAANPVDPMRKEGWASERDPLRLEPSAPDPFRFLLIAAGIFMVLAVLIAVCARVVPP